MPVDLSKAVGFEFETQPSSSFNVGAKAYGIPFSKAISFAPVPKDRKPDHIFVQDIPSDQAIIYRLSGDFNPLHFEPAIGKAAGFGGPILHGLASFGYVARGILASVGGNDPNALKAYGTRFTSPIKPGDKLETSVWEVGNGPNGTTEVSFVTRNLTSGKSAGVAYVKKAEKSKL